MEVLLYTPGCKFLLIFFFFFFFFVVLPWCLKGSHEGKKVEVLLSGCKFMIFLIIIKKWFVLLLVLHCPLLTRNQPTRELISVWKTVLVLLYTSGVSFCWFLFIYFFIFSTSLYAFHGNQSTHKGVNLGLFGFSLRAYSRHPEMTWTKHYVCWQPANWQTTAYRLVCGAVWEMARSRSLMPPTGPWRRRLFRLRAQWWDSCVACWILGQSATGLVSVCFVLLFYLIVVLCVCFSCSFVHHSSTLLSVS